MKILFVCKSNVGRSQMAEAFFNSLNTNNPAVSAGIKVGDKEGQLLNSSVIETMKKVGLDLSKKTRHQVTPELANQADKIIVMDEPKNIPDYILHSGKMVLWTIPDASDTPPEFHEKIRDMIREKTVKLSETL